MKKLGMCLFAASALTATLLAPAGADSGAQRARRLVGTWTIRNETIDRNYAGNTATGQVTFFEDQTMTIDDGGLAAAGIVEGSETPSICNRPQAPISFKILGAGAKQLMYVTWTAANRKAPNTLGRQNAVIEIIKLNRNEAILVGQGGCGALGAPRISHLTRVQ